MSHRPKVLVAMSGGVDSSVTACLLTEQGHDVVGVFMRRDDRHLSGKSSDATDPSPAADADGQHSGQPGHNWPGSDWRGSDRPGGCCSRADADDARAVAGLLGIPFYVLDFEPDFARLMDYFADEYAAARTPNPCILCNQWLKFGRLVSYADAVGAGWIATGHYARVRVDADGTHLLRAHDRAKDQSYVLFSIEPGVLRRTLLPLGELTKDEVRAYARRLGLALHEKPESQDICFVPDGDYAAVVLARRPNASRPGVIRHVDGRVLGEHDGLVRFTIGQRRGLGVATGSPIYVTELNAQTGEVTVGPRAALLSPTARASGVSWLAGEPAAPIRAEVKIRYQHAAAPAMVEPLPGGLVRVEFDEPQAAVTPGQAIVFYDGDEVLGGGWIDGR